MYRCSEKCNNVHGVSPGDCLTCRIGCFNPARWLNPFFGKEAPDDDHWWTTPYNYAEHLCADCYDRMMAELKDYEEMYGESDCLEG